jgi:hypothetical protein
MKRSFAVPTVAAILASTVVAPTFAATTYATKVGISHSTKSGGGFVGKVTSPAAFCVPNRKVTVYRKKAGKDPAIGSGWSQASGKWWLTTQSLAPGDYYAKTPAISRKGSTCHAGRSVTTHAS